MTYSEFRADYPEREKLTMREIRSMTGLAQAKFSARYGIPLRTLQSWELGERECPDYVLQMLLYIVEQDINQ